MCVHHMILTVGHKGLSPDGNILCPSAKLACLFHDKAMSASARQRYALFHYLKLCYISHEDKSLQ